MVEALIAFLVFLTIALVMLELAVAAGILGTCALSLLILTLLTQA